MEGGVKQPMTPADRRLDVVSEISSDKIHNNSETPAGAVTSAMEVTEESKSLGATDGGTCISFSVDDGAKRRKIMLQNKFKPPLMLFNELFPGSNLTAEPESSQTPQPMFKASVTANGKEYVSFGSSKQKAKSGVAVQVLTAMGIESCPSSTEPIKYPYSHPSKFSGDSAEIMDQASGFSFEHGNKAGSGPHDYKGPKGLSPWRSQFGMGRDPLFPDTPQPFQPFEQRQGMFGPVGSRNGNFPPTGMKRIIDKEKAALHPTMVMIETFPNLVLNWVTENEAAQKFFVEANVLGQTFFGEARSKRLAKANLAKGILTSLYGVTNFVDEVKAKKGTKHPLSQVRENFPAALFVLKDLSGAGEKEDVDMGNVEEGTEATSKSTVPLTSPSTTPRKYTATLTINDQVFEGEGSNKMIAKTSAARKALTALKPKVETGLKRARSEDASIDVDKHPCVVFNEIYQGNKFEAMDDDPDNKGNMFGWQVTVNDVTYTERGPSKKKAKAKLAAKIFQELHGVDPDSWADLKEKTKEQESDKIALLNLNAPPPVSQAIQMLPNDKNPVQVLHELNPSLTCEFTEESTPSNKVIYCATISIKGETFCGRAPSKKIAKLNAALLALAKMHGMEPDEGLFGEPPSEFEQRSSMEDIPRNMCDQISQLVMAKESEVLNIEEQCRVIASFVLGYKNFSGGYDNFEVVSLGTGTKCVAGDKMSTTGTVVNDCHAEVVACRAFRHFLYEQLEGIIQGKESILEKSPTGRRKLKTSIDLFVYISTAPCGDGRVFVSGGPSAGSAMNKTAGLLRTKIENGQGTIPVQTDVVQTTDGLIAGDRLLTMSCSDKIMKWNVTGVQGALLSLFVDPIYVSGLMVGQYYHHGHLRRALNERCTGLSDLPRPFITQEMTFGRPTNIEKRDTSKSSNNSCNWYKGKSVAEVVLTTSGKTVIGKVSCLAKMVFFKKFCELLKKSESNVTPQTYHDAKKMATSYQSSKSKLYSVLKEKGYGAWVSKPVETDMFGF